MESKKCTQVAITSDSAIIGTGQSDGKKASQDQGERDP